MYSRVRFNLRVGEGEHLTESGVRDEFSDMDGKSFGWRPRAKFSDCVSHGLFKLMVEMVSVNTVSFLSLPNSFQISICVNRSLITKNTDILTRPFFKAIDPPN